MIRLATMLLGVAMVATGCSPSFTESATESAKVTRIVDGDTLEIEGGTRVRFIGIDTPERGQCGYKEAGRNLDKLVNQRVTLVSAPGENNKDMHDRILRYVEFKGKDIGLEQIKSGRAIARYDSRDGYPHHPRQERYVEADEKSPSTNKC